MSRPKNFASAAERIMVDLLKRDLKLGAALPADVRDEVSAILGEKPPTVGTAIEALSRCATDAFAVKARLSMNLAKLLVGGGL